MRTVCQVVASLLVSVLLLGFKLNAFKRLVQVTQRRNELQMALRTLQPKLDRENLTVWLDGLKDDAQGRADRIAAMEPPSGLPYGTMESAMIETGMAMFVVFESSSAGVERVNKPFASVDRSETKLDKKSGLMLGRAEAKVRASPQDIVAYTLNYCSSHVGQSFAAADPNTLRSESLATVHSCHEIVFTRVRAPGIQDRTFLNAIIAKSVAEDPLTYVMVIAPIPSHDRIGRRDETCAVRGENYRSFRLTEVAPGVTKLEYCCSLDLKGWIPQTVANTVAIPQQLNGA
jgi:hypothetical protein